MCGICGKLTHKDGGVTEDLLRRMNTVLAHRGPDDEGLYLYQGRNGGSPSVSVGLAHRRLSIIDLSPAGVSPWQTRTVPSARSSTVRFTTSRF